MKKILFLIHDLGQGGAEKVLVNLVNNMDSSRFDITVVALFGGGINEQFLKPHIRFRAVFPREIPGNSHLMKLLTPKQLHRLCIKEKYDIEIAYLEGPTTRVIAGCPVPHESTKLVSWIHGEQHSMECCSTSYRSEREILSCYQHMDQIIAVANTVKEDFQNIFHKISPDVSVLYNTNESDQIKRLSNVPVDCFKQQEFKIISTGSLKQVKGFKRLIRIHSKLKKEGYPVHTYILGRGPLRSELEELIHKYGIEDSFTLLGYHTNPYKYVAKADLFVCSSYREGFSTAATEALIVGTPVCTVEVSGMKEMLGENNEYGIVTANNDEALYQGIKELVENPEKLQYYKQRAISRGKDFSMEKTVKAVEDMLCSL